MTTRYERIGHWSIPRGVVPPTLRGILRAAGQRHEGGVFWLGRRDTAAEIKTVVLLEPPGVTETRGFWEVSPVVFGVVGAWASSRGEALLAVVHSHEGRGATWLSGLDRRGGVHVPDMLAVIVPAFGAVTDPVEWGFHRFDAQEFVEWQREELMRAVEWTTAKVAVIRASAGGVQDA